MNPELWSPPLPQVDSRIHRGFSHGNSINPSSGARRPQCYLSLISPWYQSVSISGPFVLFNHTCIPFLAGRLISYRDIRGWSKEWDLWRSEHSAATRDHISVQSSLLNLLTDKLDLSVSFFDLSASSTLGGCFVCMTYSQNMWPQAKERLGPPEAGKGNEGFHPRAFRGSLALSAYIWISDFWSPVLWENTFSLLLLFWATKFVTICYTSHRKLINITYNLDLNWGYRLWSQPAWVWVLFHCLLSMYPCASYWVFLCLTFLIHQIGIITVLPTEVCCMS